MIRISTALGAFAALTTVSLAADLPGRSAAPAPSPYFAAAPAVNWTGFYFGIDIGGRNNKDSFLTTNAGGALFPVAIGATNPRNLDHNGFYVSERLGYDYQMNSFVIGVEGLIGANTGKKASYGLPGLSLIQPDRIAARAYLDYAIRARLGYLVTPATLLYVNGGFAGQSLTTHLSCAVGPWCTAIRNEAQKTSYAGYTVGAGVEQHLFGGLFARADYRYSGFGNKTSVFFANAPFDQIVGRTKLKTHTFTVGLDYKFNFGGSSAVVASKY